MNDFDVAVIGGGAARLSAALVLAWARHRVAVVEVGAQRNAPAALGDLSASSRAALSRTLKAVKAVVGNEITELDFMSEASCIIGMIVRRAESAIYRRVGQSADYVA